MKELVKHIEILLLDNDCVVVPQIGGFVTCNVPVKYIEEEMLFLPPIRTVGFNEHLKADDGLLMKSYMDAYRCTEPEARKMLGEQIRDMQQELWECGSYDLGSIGVLTLDERNNILFSPCQSGTVCPAYYGLDALLFAPLTEERTETVEASQEEVREAPVEARKVIESPKETKEYTIRLKKVWLQNIAAVAAVVLLFFLISPDAKNTGYASVGQTEFARLAWLPSVSESSLSQMDHSIPEGITGATVVPPAKKKKEKDVPVDTTDTGKKKEDTAKKDSFCIVVASSITEKNAENYVAHLHENGYKEAEVYKKGKMVRVIFPGFASESEAYAKMNTLNRSEEFASAWVYQLK
ncbi:MAG: SPOR domain-containing protein [Paraprevotella sp.]|nr:SPOR domain-containing protein [Paraprevotella sp.]